MKHGAAKVLASPVPTDHPKPRSSQSSNKSKIVRKREATEPVPQPSAARRKVSMKGRKPVVIEPLPQPQPAKLKIKMVAMVATAAPIVKSAAVRKTSRVSKKTIETIRAIQEEVAPELVTEVTKPVSEPIVPAPIPVVKSAGETPVAVAQAQVPTPESSAKPRSRRQPRPVPIEIPPILLEPDHVPGAEPQITGPGARFVVTPSVEPAQIVIPTELPEAYGTKQVFLAARDPYWLLASWDLNRGQQQLYTSRAASGALTVRLRRENADGPIHLEVHTKANSKDWFIYAGAPDTTFVAELGYHERETGAWRHISVSKAVTTPRDRVAPTPVERELQPLHSLEIPVPPPQIATPPAPPVSEMRHFAEAQPPEKERRQEDRREEIVFAIPERKTEWRWEAEQPSQREGFHHAQPERWPQSFTAAARAEEGGALESPRFEVLPGTPRWKTTRRPVWTEAQAKALDELISFELKRTQQGSIELEELIRRHLGRPEFPEEAEEELMGAPSSLELLELAREKLAEIPSSLEAIPVEGRRKDFWFKVNAELIIYGSTERDARVSIGGRAIRLREDGTFSYRFALPDGSYELPAIAISRDGDDSRVADLRFARATNYLGGVGAHPQDPALKTPAAANL